jgi:hypothetical protein
MAGLQRSAVFSNLRADLNGAPSVGPYVGSGNQERIAHRIINGDRSAVKKEATPPYFSTLPTPPPYWTM